MKALLMRSYNPAEIVEIEKITKDVINKIKENSIKINELKNKEYNIIQTLLYENDKLILREKSKQKNNKFESNQTIDVFLNENDILIKTELGYKKNIMPIKILTDKEEKTIEKYNKIGD